MKWIKLLGEFLRKANLDIKCLATHVINSEGFPLQGLKVVKLVSNRIAL